jgi:hypothetical protein
MKARNLAFQRPMKTCLSLACAVAAAAAVVPTTALALTVDYANKGTDGALVITANRTIDLSQSATRAWDATPEARGSGVYDPEKWAVVFKYSSVDIGPNATVTFNNHASRAPVVWLVDGDVTIHGTLSLNGQNQDTDQNLFRLTEPGPGGFRGGDRYVSASEPGAAGFGPGGAFFYRGNPSVWQYPSYAVVGQRSGPSIPSAPTYGNGRIIPLLGGSGGTGYFSSVGGNGGGGGGWSNPHRRSGNCPSERIGSSKRWRRFNRWYRWSYKSGRKGRGWHGSPHR